ncbi:hypothetical protein F5878DRAFT_88960 [Lentinula raphanica]|uniref:Uncharacterized protein n=1 Tax=Lentinula raphanica TaxID=153919 RepID=A0AA38PBX2_9AGAR|nr:hypothetical protein F5878DRAFT_88960 [Lentinula raphanica]
MRLSFAYLLLGISVAVTYARPLTSRSEGGVTTTANESNLASVDSVSLSDPQSDSRLQENQTKVPKEPLKPILKGSALSGSTQVGKHVRFEEWGKEIPNPKNSEAPESSSPASSKL